MQFAYEAMRPDGTTVNDLIEAGAAGDAAESLREKGLIILKLVENAGGAARPRMTLTLGGSKITTRDMVLFTRQMKMLLEAGAPLVPALEATEEQTAKPVMRALLHRLRDRVEGGESLSDAIEPESANFDPVFRSMVAAGEATATLPDVFGRLSDLIQQHLRTRKQVLGAMIYPSILSCMLLGVVLIMMLFVVPRFNVLFTNLNSELPGSTAILFGMSNWLKAYWMFLLGGIAVTVGGLYAVFRMESTRIWVDHVMFRLPVVGKLIARLIFARVIRVWAAMLRCHVPLLEAITQSREAVSNAAFLELIDDVEETVSGGGRIAQAIERTKLADPIIISAIRTGEENSRLAEAADFVSNWMDEDNANMIQSVTRMAEPLILAFMGLVVGFVAMALFIPLFDIATAAG